jgi:hypothetical protein
METQFYPAQKLNATDTECGSIPVLPAYLRKNACVAYWEAITTWLPTLALSLVTGISWKLMTPLGMGLDIAVVRLWAIDMHRT